MFPDNQQFDGNNYPIFRDHALLAVRARGALGYLNGTIAKLSPLPTTTGGTTNPEATPWTSNTPSPEEWEVRDAWTLSLLIYNTKNPTGLGVNMAGTAAEAWKALSDKYDCASEIAAVAAESHLQATKLTKENDFWEHVKTL
ncbi:hypothetical protein C0991_010533 [Blastosporella zonata]|nr:hypothetical protein C0991_010533 [Blastosporella zonata]